MSKGTKTISVLALLLILAIAVFFRLWQLNEIPPGLYPDVAINGTNALEAIKTGDYKVFYPENNGREGLFMNLIACSFLIFGPSVWAIKIIAALFGFLTVIGTYFLTRQLFKYLDNKPSLCPFGIETSNSIALFSAFFIAVSFWHVNFSRLGFRAIMVPFFLVWGLYFLIKAIQIFNPSADEYPNNPNKKIIISYFLFLISGLTFGLGFHTYIAFRIAPLIIIPIFIFDIIKNWPRFKLSRWLIFIFGTIIAAAPLAYYYIQNAADFMGRAGQVSIFASTDPVKTLAFSTIKTLGQFVVWGDANWRHNLSGSPEIFWPLIPFFIIGIFYSILKIFQKKNYIRENLSLVTCHWMLLVAWGAMLLPSITTNEGLPHALRSIGATVPSYIFVGVGFYFAIAFLYTKLKKYENLFFAYKYFFTGLVLLFLVFIGAMEYIRYFIIWGQNEETKNAFTQKYVNEANYLNSLPPNIQKFVIVNENGTPVPYPDGIPMPAQTIMFLTAAHQPATEVKYLKTDQISQLPNCGSCQIIILPMTPDKNLFLQLISIFPDSRTETIGDFTVLKINF